MKVILLIATVNFIGCSSHQAQKPEVASSEQVKTEAERSPASTVRVKGYMKRDGTYVAPHIRTSPDSSIYNNFNPRPKSYKSKSRGW
jgi:hypothetical protein